MPDIVPLSLTTCCFSDIEAAARRIAPYVHRTPVMVSELINREAGCDILFKCENLQRVGAFKARGAHNAVLCLDQRQRSTGVATHSSGNHAAALALAASHFGIPAFIVMPENAPATKVAAVRAYGGDITFCEATLAARESTLGAVCRRTGATFIPPYDSAAVIAGQGTCGLEIAEQVDPAPDILLAPVGGGGLLAGCAIAAKKMLPGTRVIGAEPAGADDARRSFVSGSWQPQLAPDTVADGLRTSLGRLNFDLISQYVDDILCADDSAIIDATRLIWTRMKLVVEPSAAVGLAVVLSHPGHFAGQRVAIVLSGGNVDIDKLPW
jgi:threonine dehydratase